MISITPRNPITARGTVEIGKYCAIGENVRIISQDHDYNYPAMRNALYREAFNETAPQGKSGAVIIGNDVWIGDNVTILKGVTVGDGACIGAGSIVTKTVLPYSIVAGNPAKAIKFRFNIKITAFLLDLKWWDWSEDKITANKEFFYTNLNDINDIEYLEKIIKG